MKKRVIKLTENELSAIVQKVINEQNEQKSFIRAVQRFLNGKINSNLTVDGKTGPNSKTEDAISKYQTMIKVYPADGVWGVNTWEKMPIEDKKQLKKLVADEGGLIDKFLNWIGLD